MLFGSVVLMYKTLCTQSITVFIVFSLNLDLITNAQTQREKTMQFSGDFETFLKDLGSLVYKTKNKFTTQRPTTRFLITTTVQYTENQRRNEALFNTQKAALRDVLMMKLVSYYEDKYKLAHYESTGTEEFTFLESYTEPYVTPAIKYKHNEVDASNRKYPPTPRNRGYEGLNMRRNYVDTAPLIPEVVIL